MARLRVSTFSLSLDGYGAGPEQSLDHPVGVGGRRLHAWLTGTAAFRERFGMAGGHDGLDDEVARHADDGVGATIMGRNMFGPVRGPWPDDAWKGWWGEAPPYGHPTFVLTSHAREPEVMAGGTTFHFVTGGIHEAFDRAVEAADGRDVKVAGGVATVRQYLAADLVDDLEVVIVPILLGRGERLWEGLDDVADRFRTAGLRCSSTVTHVRLVRRGGAPDAG